MPRPHNTSGCKVNGCDGEFFGKGYCYKHYYRLRRGGDPHTKSRAEKTERERFDEKIERTRGCWLWRGAINNKGYGQFGRKYAHRRAYEFAYGPIPEGLNIMHVCDVPNCVRPDHLRAGTQLENIRDAKAKGRIAAGARLPQYKHGRYCIAYRG